MPKFILPGVDSLSISDDAGMPHVFNFPVTTDHPAEIALLTRPDVVARGCRVEEPRKTSIVERVAPVQEPLPLPEVPSKKTTSPKGGNE